MEGNNTNYNGNMGSYYHSSSGTGGGTQSSLTRGGYSSQNSSYAGGGTSSYGSRPNYTQSQYQSGSAYRQTSQSRVSQPQPQPQASVKTKKSSTFKKVLVGGLVGIVFGVFAGTGFFAISLAGNAVKDKIPGLGDDKPAVTQQTTVDNGNTQTPPAPQQDNSASSASANTQSSAVQNAPDLTAAADSAQGITTVTDVTQVVANSMPSLVSVNNKYTEKLNYFGQTYYQDTEGAGSGIIVGQNDEELLIVSNYHVVKNANELTVTFVDNSEAQAEVKGQDADKDLAVITVQLDSLSDTTKNAITIAKLGDSDALTVGEPVIAIGNSLGYGQSVTTGVVSALNRKIAATTGSDSIGDQSIENFIQTDAAINPGNSGGALLNIKGEVIGINSNKIGGSAVEGMGYAIPIASAKPIIDEMITKQSRLKVSEENKGILGITGVDVDAEYSEIYGIPIGVYVSSVNAGSGADEAGLVRGDIIVGINGEDITCMDDLKFELSYYSAGTSVEISYMQGTPNGYVLKTMMVTLGAVSQ